MPEPKKIWTGTWMGIAAHVEMIGGVPVPFLAGRRAQFEADVHGILGAAVVGLAAERDAAQVKLVLPEDAEAFVQEVEARAENIGGPWVIRRDELPEEFEDSLGYPSSIGPLDHVEFLPEDPAEVEHLARFVSWAPYDVSRLVAIVRGQRGRLVDLEADNRAAYAERDTLQAERDALRDRLAKLEDALGYAVTQLEAANELISDEDLWADDDGVQDVRDWIHGIRSTLLKEGGHNGEASKI